MANLVSPGYDSSTLINRVLAPQEQKVIEFRGLNRKITVMEGEMSDMQNMSADAYPVLSQRRLRGTMSLPADVLRPLKIISKYERIAMIALQDDAETIAFYYDGVQINDVNDLNENTMMVTINTKICFFPQKTYLEVTRNGQSVTVGSYGSLEESQSVSALAVTVSNEDARITIAGHKFGYDDAINIEGTLSYKDSDNQNQSLTVTASCIIEEVDNDTLVLPRETFIELTGEGATDIELTGDITRTMPHLDHVIEWNNRLWGASNEDNVVYACKLGDPKNWQYFQGTSLDSYYAQQGTDENWTGCATYSNHLIFFKPSSMCRIYGTAPSNFQITNADCYGVEDGSRRSVITINDKVFYKSSIGIMAYDGGIPYCISDKFNVRFRNVVAGTEGTKYYASIQVENGGYELMVLDIDKAMWHKEDNLRFRNCCVSSNRLYYVEYADDLLYCDTDVLCDDYLIIGSGDSEGSVGIINPLNASEKYEDLPWMAVFGPFDEYLESKKIYSKISFRIAAQPKSTFAVYISLDDGPWELVRSTDNVKVGGDIIQIVPRRCDRYSVMVAGTGKCDIKSLTRRYRAGTFGKL